MTHRRLMLVIVSLSLLMAAVACMSPSTPPPTSTTPATLVPTQTSGQPTLILPTPGTLGPTPTTLPAPTSGGTTTGGSTGGTTTGGTIGGGVQPTQVPSRVNVAAGATFTNLTGTLAARQTASYILNIGANQLIDVSVETASPAQLEIVGADGSPLKTTMSEGAFFRGTVPKTQDYIVRVLAGDQPITYSLNIVIPQRVTFAPGATSTVKKGAVQANSQFHFVINLQANQVLDVSLDPQQGDKLIVYGADGNVLQSGMGDFPAFRGAVPTAQDYIVTVAAADKPVNFTANFIVPRRIMFASGATSASIDDTLDPYTARHYVFNAKQGQQLDVTITPDKSGKMSIYGIDGTVLWSGMGEGTHFTGTIPVSQDYFVVFQTGDAKVTYKLTVTIK